MSAAAPSVTHPDHVTSDWLERVLGAPADSLRSFDAGPIGTGQVGENMRYDLDWIDGGPDLPSTVVMKFAAFDEVSRSTGVATKVYEREVWFYEQLASTVDAPVPHCHHAAVVEGTADMVLVLEDLAPAEQGDQLAGCSVDDARIALRALAGLHAPRWNDPSLAEIEWMGQPNTERAEQVAGIVELVLPGFLERYAERLDAQVLEIATRFGAERHRYFAPVEGPTTLTHGDYRLDNLLFRRDGAGRPVAVVDWGGVARGSAGNDVGYFLGAGLLPEVGAAHELELVADYHAALVDRGVAGFSLDACVEQYRRGAFSGLAMAIIASQIVRQEERGDEMFCVMAERHAAQIERLDSFATLR